MTMPMNGFMEMTDDEMLEVDGGSRGAAILGGILAGVGVVAAGVGCITCDPFLYVAGCSAAYKGAAILGSN